MTSCWLYAIVLAIVWLLADSGGVGTIRSLNLPFGILGFDQSDFFFPPPSFHLLLPPDRRQDATVSLEVDKPSHVVFVCESSECVRFMLEDPALKVARNSNIEHATLAAENVDVVSLVHAKRMQRGSWKNL